jgi:glucose/arabinose dehydrogenase
MNYSKKYFGWSFFLIVLLFNTACADSSSAITSDADFPVVLVSKNVPKFRVETVATNLEVVWSIVFAPDGRIFFTERPGRVRVIENGKLRAAPFFTVPDVELSGESGLMGMTLHPNFTENHFVYLAYAYQDANKNQTVRVARFRETSETLVEPKTIIEAIPEIKCRKLLAP